MIHFIPTFGSRQIAKETNDFIGKSMDVFWAIFKPLTPYIAGLITLDAIITNTLMPTGQSFSYGKLASYYFMACLAISWLRLCIHGKENLTPINPFKPNKTELEFMGVALLIFSLPIIITTAMPFITANTDSFITSALLGFMASLLIAFFTSYKFAFYFPSQANVQGITLPQSFKMTKGYVEKTISTTMRAGFKLIIKMVLFLIAIKGTEIILGHTKSVNPYIVIAYDLIPALVLSLYFIPLLIITGLGVLSHYYRKAMEKEALKP